jgi:uncharacterized membrane protein YjjP (DUF1212 family)
LDKVNVNKQIDNAKKKLEKTNFESKRKNKNLDMESDKDYLKRSNDYKNVELDKTDTSDSQTKSYKKYYVLAGILLIGGGIFLYYNPDIIAGALAAITSIREDARNLT